MVVGTLTDKHSVPQSPLTAKCCHSTFRAAFLIATLVAVMQPPAASTRSAFAALAMLGVPWSGATLLTLTEHRGGRVEAV